MERGVEGGRADLGGIHDLLQKDRPLLALHGDTCRAGRGRKRLNLGLPENRKSYHPGSHDSNRTRCLEPSFQPVLVIE
jgi:hypothetical protein